MTLDEEQALHIALLPDPEAAMQFVELLQDGKREEICAKMCGLSPSKVRAWREASEVFNAMCSDAKAVGTASIDDTVVIGVKTYQTGWASAAKLILNQRDDTYADRQKIERDDTVKLVEVHRQETPENWEKPA